MIDGRTWGVLEVDTQHKTKFDEVDVEFLGTMANIVASAIARHEAEKQSVEALTHTARQKLEAETALRELQHRTKNNLQVIVSLLAIKKRQVESEEAREVLSAAMRRVEAVALAHDLLAPGDGAGSVELGEYLRSLCASFEPEQRGINIHVDAAEARIPLNRAVPAALIVNELVTNSIKYAFGNAGGTIVVTFKVLAHCSEACIRVDDDGAGLKLPPKPGVGLKLVDGLSKQIGGRVQHLKVESGTSTQICFPVALGQ
jgi:two-component sensor histidine kinase